MKQILITTTPTLANANILQYCGIVTTNVVIGVNFFSDFVASFSDFFGGNSGTYQRKLDGIYEEVINGLELKAMQKSANAIIGLHIDFDEISGKGKQMFMATAVGTACKVEFLDNSHSQLDSSKGVSHSTVEQLCMSRLFQNNFERKDWAPSLEDWEYILTHYMPELASSLIACFFTLADFQKENYLQNLNLYLATLPYSLAIDALYPFLEEHPKDILPLIEKNMLFNADKVLNYIENGNLSLAISLLDKPKEHYNMEDLTKMENIISKFENLPDKGKIEKVVSGLFSKKEEEMYICPNGHKNDINAEFCGKYDCELNIKGLNRSDVAAIKIFTNKVKALKDILTD